MVNYRYINFETWYRKDIFRHFSEDAKCSVSITNRISVNRLYDRSKEMGRSFYLNFLWILSKVLNSREEYRLSWNWQTQELIAYDQINPTQYIFHDDTKTFTLAYTEYDPIYEKFYFAAKADKEDAQLTREYRLDIPGHPNWFDASCIPWLSYDSLHVELPDGHLWFNPIINWGKYQNENGVLRMPVTVRLNHAVADGWLIANVFQELEREISLF